MSFQSCYAGKQVCYTCAHYQQHYYREEEQYYEVFYGHCITPRLKIRRPSQTCQLWTPRVPELEEEK